MKSILILNGTLVNEGRLISSDIRVKGGRIEQIGPELPARPGDVLINAAGKHIFPGLIDDQVHFREPGLTHKATIASESRAAVAGGVTSFMEMPNTSPPAVTLELLEEKYRIASATSMANYSFYLGATNDNIEELKRMNPGKICGIKVFMGSSTGNMLVDNQKTLAQIFAAAPAVVAAHCEDTPTIQANEDSYRKQFGEAVPFACHPLIRSEEACYRSSSMAVELAQKHGTRLHILHISTQKELSLFSNTPLAEKRITAEACVHHLFFDDASYEEKGARLKCNPAIKSAADRYALRDAVIEGKIDVIATDHAPHTVEEKNRSYFKAPSGLPLVQHSLQLLLELYHDGIFTLPLIAEKTAHAPAVLFNVQERGYIREGYYADLVIADLAAKQTAAQQHLFSKCGWSPFDGYTFRSRIDTTIINGHIAFRDGRIDESKTGQRLSFKL